MVTYWIQVADYSKTNFIPDWDAFFHQWIVSMFALREIKKRRCHTADRWHLKNTALQLLCAIIFSSFLKNSNTLFKDIIHNAEHLFGQLLENRRFIWTCRCFIAHVTHWNAEWLHAVLLFKGVCCSFVHSHTYTHSHTLVVLKLESLCYQKPGFHSTVAHFSLKIFT